ncbi:MAG: DNA repair protein RecN [Flavobacteriaceae bacterium]|nr:DNA repair protein RecN [Flavobacteriaceae bacterium]
MLTELSISNFALIDQLEVNFSNGMTSITGETGAGKSILLGGLALVLGKRADLSTLKDKSRKCFIDATFSISAYGLQDFFHSVDLDYEAITTVRREIVPSGKSRAFINDTPVTLDVLQQLGERLIDVHSQHQTMSLVQEDYQLDVLDALAKNAIPLKEYSAVLKTYKAITRKIDSLSTEKKALEEERDYNRFLLDELNAAPLTENSMEDMESEIQELSSVEELEENLTKALQIIEEEQMGVAVQLNEVRASLQKVAGISERYEQLSSRVESLRIELTDVSSELSNAQEMVEANPSRLEMLNGQLQLLNDLLKKHHVQSLAELVERRNQLEQKVIQTENLEEDLQSLVKEQKGLIVQLDTLSQKLSENRQKAIPVFMDQMEKILSLLGMPNARFNLTLIASDDYLSHGKEKLDFTFSANQGSDFGSLKKVASGGELSRIMLSIKAILSQFKTLPTIIFDEIDTGVSGEVAYKIADIMHHMGKYMQVMTITHLPQVAAKGAHHFKVFKETRDGSTFTQLKKLQSQERIEEVAQMLAGDALSDTALQHAKELLN